MARVKLTQKYIDNPPPVPAGKAKEERCDLSLPGLLFEQRAVNQEWGSFRLRYKSGGKTTYVTIGRSCDISLADARQKAKQLKAEIQLGADPQADVRAKRKGMTWDEFFETEWKPYSLAHKRSHKGDLSMQKQISPRLGSVPLSAITKKHFQDLHLDIRNSGRAPATANHFGKLMRKVLSHACDIGVLQHNALTGIKLFDENNQKDRYLSQKELTSLLTTLKNDKNQGVARLIHFLICTGCRLGEAKSASWSQVDLAHKRWTMPPSKVKSKKLQSKPLGTAAVELLEGLPRSKTTDHLFYSDCTGKPFKCIKTVWSRIRKDAGLGDDVTLHILRHTFASICINEGRTLYEVSKLLSHSSVQVTERYAHLAPSTLEDATNAVSNKITEALNATKN